MPPVIEGVKLPSFEPTQLRLVPPKSEIDNVAGAVMTKVSKKVQADTLLLSVRDR